MIVACSVCRARFEAEGYRDLTCRACGVIAQQTTNACPRCVAPLQPRQVADLNIDDCAVCGGVFLEHETIDRVLVDRERTVAGALLANVRGTPTSAAEIGSGWVACPRCNTAMERRLSATGAGVVLDVCRPHGVYFDAGELHAIVAFVEREAREQAKRRAEEQQYRWRRGVFDPPRPARQPKSEASDAASGLASAGLLFLRILVSLL